jgi:hypothetical protein
MRRTRRLLPFLLIAAASSLVTAAALALPALAEEPDDRLGFRERMRAFEECMREHGFDLRPEDGRVELRVTPEGVWLNGEKVDGDAFREARRECGPPLRAPFRGDPELLPALPFGENAVPPELRERMERFRDCLDLEQAPEEDV